MDYQAIWQHLQTLLLANKFSRENEKDLVKVEKTVKFAHFRLLGYVNPNCNHMVPILAYIPFVCKTCRRKVAF